MDGNPDFKDLLRAFAEQGVRYLIVGAYAVMHYTEPRYTKDLDLWVDPSRANAERVWRALRQFGSPLGGMAVEDFTNPQVVFQIGVEPNRVDIVMGITRVQFSTAWRNRVRASYDGQPISVLGKRDLVRNKRAVGRPADELDVRRLKAADRRRIRSHGRKK